MRLPKRVGVPISRVYKKGLVAIELGQARRICRCCRKKIVKGTYHVVLAAESGSYFKICQQCIHQLNVHLRWHNKE